MKILNEPKEYIELSYHNKFDYNQSFNLAFFMECLCKFSDEIDEKFNISPDYSQIKFEIAAWDYSITFYWEGSITNPNYAQEKAAYDKWYKRHVIEMARIERSKSVKNIKELSKNVRRQERIVSKIKSLLEESKTNEQALNDLIAYIKITASAFSIKTQEDVDSDKPHDMLVVDAGAEINIVE